MCSTDGTIRPCTYPCSGLLLFQATVASAVVANENLSHVYVTLEYNFEIKKSLNPIYNRLFLRMSEPGIADGPAGELFKENAQPLKRGRDAGRLGLKLQARSDGPGSADSSAAATAAKVQAFEAAVAAEALADADDPLGEWLKYLHWVREEFPSGTGAAKATELMERCTRCFNHDPRYRNDERLVKVTHELHAPVGAGLFAPTLVHS